ncbi:hypothetical protein ACFQX6_28890 [Streptosporangium lutulentum]
MDDSAWGVYTEDPAVVMMAAEYIRNDIAMEIIADRVGHDSLREIWAADPELRRLRTGHGRPAALLRAVGGRILTCRSPTDGRIAGK